MSLTVAKKSFRMLTVVAETLLQAQQFSDVTVRVGLEPSDQTDFGLHKIILAATSQFFHQKFIESDENVVVVKMSAKDFELCMNFMYSGHAIVNPDEVLFYLPWFILVNRIWLGLEHRMASPLSHISRATLAVFGGDDIDAPTFPTIPLS